LKFVSYFHASISVLTLFLDMYQCEYLLRLWQFTAIFICLPYAIHSIYLRAIREKIPNSKRLFTGMVITLIAGIYDIVDSAVLNTGFALSKYAFFAYVMTIATILANKFIYIHNRMEELNENLEQKVVDRTKEVVEKMQEIEALNIQQNGDYFLTSLIEKPLTTNYNKSRYVKSTFYIEQKKKFEFRDRKSELGGDLCITGNLRFYNEQNRYVFFFNGDAMGKSMQGAGGAIVAGTVVNNILGRSARNDRVLTISPAEWMEEIYKELDSVFRTFDGSMLLSAVLGIIDEATGEMWYFNAEHPYLVLYRDEVAGFLGEDAPYMPKLGTELSIGEFTIMKFALEPGDILFCGSDGRDDIEFVASGNTKVLNEDETLFLRNVEKGKGDIKQVVKYIKEKGRLTDDLSLIRLSYRMEFAPSVQNVPPINSTVT
ncbi:MAG: PP2C family protein-serine/threonine phosphatase, partial [Spirochaetota bacterium]